MKCNQCTASMINGIFCHEAGCPNIGKRWDNETQEFVNVYACAECGSEYNDSESLELCCQLENLIVSGPDYAESQKEYDVFIRDWWVYEDTKHAGRRIVPGPGEKTYIVYGLTRDEALTICKDYNDSHDPGELSRKAEFEEA